MNEKTQTFLSLSVRPWGVLMAAGAVACFATILGFFGNLSWLLDVFSHFRVQYLLGLGLLSLVLFFAQRRKIAVIFIAFACINLGVVLPLYFGRIAVPPEGAHALRVMLLNVNTRSGDPERVKQFVQQTDPDFVVLEEISSQWTNDLQWLAISHPYSCVQSREDNFGIGLYSKVPLAESNILCVGDADIPSIVARIETSDGPLAIIATHPLPPWGARYSTLRNDQLKRLPDYIPDSISVILLGDLNVTPWNHYFRRLLERTGLKDSSQGHGVQPTWPNHNPFLLIPIDHCLHSPDILVLNKEVGPDVGSDHYPVVMDFVIMRGGKNKGVAR